MGNKTKTSQFSDEVDFVKRIMFFSVVLIASIFCLALFVPGPMQKNAYMGDIYCASCHQAEYQSWLLSPHSKAFDNLADEHKNNSACLSCHATGVSTANEPFFKGVSCEACHGPGQYYASIHVKKDPVLSRLLFMQEPNEASCRHCHLASTTLWSFHHAVKKIDHWSEIKKLPFHGMNTSGWRNEKWEDSKKTGHIE